MAYSPELLAAYRSVVARRAATFETDGVASLDNAGRAASKHSAIREVLNQLGLLDSLAAQFSFIHVTGTSGKGSVVKLIHDILAADHKKVGSLVTPYTTTYLESFLVGPGLLDPKILIESANEILSIVERTQVHIATNLPIALNAFAKCNLDWAVIEVGRGGRYDATNVIPSPKVAVITNVDLDHRTTLGNTLEAIAWQKAGIIKPGCHVVCGEHRPELREIFAKEAHLVGASIEFVPWNEDYQEHNKALARAATLHLGIDNKVIEQAISSSQGLPCRFEIIQTAPRIIIDGAHNAAKIAATASRLSPYTLPPTPYPLVILFGCKSSKNASELLAPLIPLATTIHTTRYLEGAGKPANPQQLLSLIPKDKRGVAYDSPHEALAAVRSKLSLTDTLLITGSLYLAGELRTHWITEEQIISAASHKFKVKS